MSYENVLSNVFGLEEWIVWLFKSTSHPISGLIPSKKSFFVSLSVATVVTKYWITLSFVLLGLKYMNVSGTPCKPPHGVFTDFPDWCPNCSE